MATVKWTPQAQADLQAIVAYYEEVAPGYAEVFEDKVLATTNRLEIFPRSGRIVPEIEDEVVREVIYRNYRIMYILDEETDVVEILTIFHASRQFGL